VGDDVRAEVFLGPDPAGEINEWGAADGRVVAVDGEHLDVRTNGHVLTVHRAFVRRSFAASGSRSTHLRPHDGHGTGPAKGPGAGL